MRANPHQGTNATLNRERAIQVAHAASEPTKVTAARLGVSIDYVIRARVRMGLTKRKQEMSAEFESAREIEAKIKSRGTGRCAVCHLLLPHECIQGNATKGIGTWAE